MPPSSSDIIPRSKGNISKTRASLSEEIVAMTKFTNESENVDSILNSAYDSDTSAASTEGFIISNEYRNFLLNDSVSSELNHVDYPILRSGQLNQGRDKQNLSTGDGISLDDSNKENINNKWITVVNGKESLRRTREPKRADFFGSYVGYLKGNSNNNNSVSSVSDVGTGHCVKYEKEHTTFVKQSGKSRRSEKKGRSDIIADHLKETERPQSAPCMDEKSCVDIEVRPPLRPITVRNLNDLDLEELVVIGKGYPIKKESNLQNKGNLADKDRLTDVKLHVVNGGASEEGTCGPVQLSPKSDLKAHAAGRKREGYLSTLNTSGHMSPFIRAITSRYHLFDGQSRFMEEESCDFINDGISNSMEEDLQIRTVRTQSLPSTYKYIPSANSTLEEDSTYLVAMLDNSENIIDIEEETSTNVMNRHRHRAGNKTGVEAVTELPSLYFHGEIRVPQEKFGGLLSDQRVDEGGDSPADLLKSLHSKVVIDDEKLAFERDLEENLQNELEDFEKFIQSDSMVPQCTDDILNTSFLSDESEELTEVKRDGNLWVSPTPKNVKRPQRLQQKITLDLRNNSRNESTQTLEHYDSELECSTYTCHMLQSPPVCVQRRDAATSTMAELLCYNTSMEESFVCDSPVVSPYKVKSKPRYSSSPVTKDSGQKRGQLDEKHSNSRCGSNHSIEKQRFVNTDPDLIRSCSEKRKKRLSFKRVLRLKREEEPVTLLSYTKFDPDSSHDSIEDDKIMGDISNKTKPESTSEMKMSDNACSNKSLENEQKLKFIEWDGVSNSVETFFTQRLGYGHSEERLLGDGDCAREKQITKDVESEADDSVLILKKTLELAPEREYDAESANDITESCTVVKMEPASLSFLALHSFKAHLRMIQEGMMFEIENAKEEATDNKESGSVDLELDIEIDEISPDSPSLIASMSKDVRRLNLTKSPAGSDAEMSHSLNAFLQEALKPIDDLSLQAESSDSDLDEEGQIERIRTIVDAEDPLDLIASHSKYKHCYGNKLDTGDDSDDEALIEDRVRVRLEESVDRYPSFTYCSPMSTGVLYEAEESDEEDEHSLYSEDRQLPVYINNMLEEESEGEYSGFVMETPHSPCTPLPTPERDAEETSASEEVHVHVSDERYPKFTLGSLPPLLEDEEEDTSEDFTRRIMGIENEYPGGLYDDVTVSELEERLRKHMATRACLDEVQEEAVGHMTTVVLDNLYNHDVFGGIVREFERVWSPNDCSGMENREPMENQTADVDDSVLTVEGNEQFFTDVETDLESTMEKYFTDNNETDLDNTV